MRAPRSPCRSRLMANEARTRPTTASSVSRARSLPAGLFRKWLLALSTACRPSARRSPSWQPARIIVYPLFASSGYFTRDRLVQLLDTANDENRNVEVLPPIGHDPGLPDLVLKRAAAVARECGFAPDVSTVILLAHGSRRNSASREVTEQVARAIEDRASFRGVGIALLEERPFLDEALAPVEGPAVVVGMFSGEGMHGAGDAPRLIAELNRNDVVYAGVIGNVAGIEDLVATAVEGAVRRPAP